MHTHQVSVGAAIFRCQGQGRLHATTPLGHVTWPPLHSTNVQVTPGSHASTHRAPALQCTCVQAAPCVQSIAHVVAVSVHSTTHASAPRQSSTPHCAPSLHVTWQVSPAPHASGPQVAFAHSTVQRSAAPSGAQVHFAPVAQANAGGGGGAASASAASWSGARSSTAASDDGFSGGSPPSSARSTRGDEMHAQRRSRHDPATSRARIGGERARGVPARRKDSGAPALDRRCEQAAPFSSSPSSPAP